MFEVAGVLNRVLLPVALKCEGDGDAAKRKKVLIQ